MTIHYHFIINEHAASGKGKKVAESILQLAKNQVTYTPHYSQYPGHVYKIIAELKEELTSFEIAATDFPLLVVIGGDGTLHEVMNALYPDHLNTPVGYIPAGSGNDFARGIHLTRNPKEAWQQILQTTKPKKVNLIRYQEENSKRSGVLVNNLGIGLDASIVHVTNESVSKKALNQYHLGSFSYIISIVRKLFTQKPFPIVVEVNGEKESFPKDFLCSITNHPYFGGGVPIAPKASPFEKGFDVVIVERIAILKILYLILLVIKGTHLENKNVHFYQSKKMRVVSHLPQYAQLDGEVWQAQEYDFTFDTTEGFIWF